MVIFKLLVKKPHFIIIKKIISMNICLFLINYTKDIWFQVLLVVVIVAQIILVRLTLCLYKVNNFPSFLGCLYW